MSERFKKQHFVLIGSFHFSDLHAASLQTTPKVTTKNIFGWSSIFEIFLKFEQ